MTEDDAALVLRARDGDKQAFAALYERYYDRVFDFLARMMRDQDEAADVAQDTFLRAMGSLATLREGATFKPWLFTIARNQALNRLERAGRTTTLSGLQGDDEDAPAYDLPDTAPLANPAEAAESNELAAIVWEAAAALDARQYSLLDLHVRQGLESAEIAEVLGVTKNNAYVMVNRLKSAFEGAVGALVLYRAGRGKCAGLDSVISSIETKSLTPEMRKAIDKHANKCVVCQQRRANELPMAAFAGLALVQAPLGAKATGLDALMSAWSSAGPGAAANAATEAANPAGSSVSNSAGDVAPNAPNSAGNVPGDAANNAGSAMPGSDPAPGVPGTPNAHPGSSTTAEPANQPGNGSAPSGPGANASGPASTAIPSPSGSASGSGVPAAAPVAVAVGHPREKRRRRRAAALIASGAAVFIAMLFGSFAVLGGNEETPEGIVPAGGPEVVLASGDTTPRFGAAPDNTATLAPGETPIPPSSTAAALATIADATAKASPTSTRTPSNSATATAQAKSTATPTPTPHGTAASVGGTQEPGLAPGGSTRTPTATRTATATPTRAPGIIVIPTIPIPTIPGVTVVPTTVPEVPTATTVPTAVPTIPPPTVADPTEEPTKADPTEEPTQVIPTVTPVTPTRVPITPTPTRTPVVLCGADLVVAPNKVSMPGPNSTITFVVSNPAGCAGPVSFAASPSAGWLFVSPSAAGVPDGGSVAVTVTANGNAPSVASDESVTIHAGAETYFVLISYNPGGGFTIRP